VKLSLKRGYKKPKKRTVVVFAAVMFAIVAAGSFLFLSNAKAAVNIDNSLNFASVPGYWRYQTNGAKSCPGESKYDFCASDRMFLEVAQKSGPGANVNTTLDVKEIWTKSYIDPNRLGSAVIGIYDGKYSRVKFGASDEYDANGNRQTFNDNQDVIFEFYVAQDVARIVDGNVQFDEVPCLSGDSRKPFYTADSSTMPKNGWAKINVRQRLNASSGACKTAVATKKTGRVVIFTRAYWRNPNNLEGRVNAFKVGTAYTDKSTDLANTAPTGFFSDYSNAVKERSSIVNPAQRDSGQYAIQNRIDSENTQGRYYFGFAPDCRLAPGAKEKRYIKWKDVDFPNYYPAGVEPRFRLLDVTNASNVRVVKDVDGNDMDLSGSQLGGPDQYRERQVEFTGGRMYEWHWYNITRNDGIAFWMPYDDFPTLVGGCGNYQQKIGLWAGQNNQGMSQNANQVVRGGDTLNLLINQGWSAPSQPPGPAPFTTTDAFLTTQNGTYDGTFSGLPTSINEGGSRYQGSRNHIQWKLQGLGPTPAYQDSRWLIYSYKIKEDAVNGSKHCFLATMNNETSKQPPLNPGNVATSNTICVTIDNSLKPYLTTTGGDVHAGDCSITGLRNNGKITGQGVAGSARGSSGSFIVSANDLITNFGSGGSPTGGSLTFGKGGRYGTLCRPTIDQISTYFKEDTAELKLPDASNVFDLSSLPAGGRYKVEFSGNGRVKGVSKSTVTLYSRSGTIAIDGSAGSTVGSDITQAAVRGKLPTVGIIARDIAISRTVTKINAVMYATYNIDTCSISDWVNQCKSTLTVNGFAMARDFSFKRVSGASSNLQVGERIDFNAAFYLNAPPGFTDASTLVKYLGERAPLY
jgi:hypothetical protein